MKKRTWVAALASTSLVATLGLVGISIPVADATTPVQVPAGTLSFITGATDQLVYDKGTASTADDAVQPVGRSSPTSCNLAPTSGDLLTWSASGGVPGLLFDSVGVTSPQASVLSCNRVNSKPAEALTLSLNRTPGGIYDTPFGQAYANAANLDIEMKGDGALVKAVTSKDGAVTGTFYLALKDDDWYKKSTTTQVPAGTTICGSSKYDQPSSTSNRDNCYWSISGVNFDSITLSAVRGAFSLEGGGDWGCIGTADTHRTTFSLVVDADGELCVGGTANSTSNSVFDQSTITRLPDAGATTDACGQAVVYTLDTDATGVTFRKPASAVDAQFLVQITREYTTDLPNPVPALRINWLDDPDTGAQDIPWCPESVYSPESGNGGLTDFNAAGIPEGADGSSQQPGVQYTCLYDSDPTLVDGVLTQVDSFYLIGDPKYGAF
jgi:hypothetical protein